jgi:hypothetical protein
VSKLGVFSYTRVPQGILYAGVDRLVDEAGDVFFMASPLKALAGYVHVHKKDWYDFLWYTSRKTPVNLVFLAVTLGTIFRATVHGRKEF